MQDEIARSAYQHQQDIESGAKTVVGINRFQHESEVQSDILKISASSEKDQVKRLTDLRSGRDNQKIKLALSKISDAAKEVNAPLMEHIIFGVESYCTVGEISDALRNVWGEYRNSS